MKELAPRFDFQSEEPNIYKAWLASGGFSPSGKGEPRSILMPPINANGQMHIGHAYEVAIQDSLIRYWRLRGFNTLWQPGVDHAGFETQIVFEKKLEKEGRTRFGMERGQLYDEIFAFSKANQAVIRGQLERMGASADWSRFKFMLDPPLVKTVYQTFKKLYDDGLVYRAKRPVNWCVKHQTTLSDLETKYEERQDAFYYFQYGPFVIGTARPETKFGDKYVVVHPDDERYAQYNAGQTFEIEWINGPVTATLIKDTAVDPEFGTGAMTITPWHDPIDFDIAQRHNLDFEQVIDFRGRLLPLAGEFAEIKIAEARPLIVEKLKAKGLLLEDKTNNAYLHNVQLCYKCSNLIEPQIKDQWWLALTKATDTMSSLRDQAVEAVASGKSKFISEKFENQFHRWMENIRDWPLSRQIVWGIQIPVWYRGDEIMVTDGAAPEGDGWERDADVFDTWFSSCQWPFSTLGNTEGDLETFYPTTVMAPGYDILFFWVARMLMLGLYTQKEVPYKTIFMHGLVRDKDRQKMSKSKGNVVDPLGVAEEYGADAVRISLLYGSAPGTDPVISDEKIRGMRNFSTKLWNIGRYVAMNIEPTTKAEFIAATDADSAIHKKWVATLAAVTDAMENYQLHIALEHLYGFIWNDLADVYIEAAKNQLADESTKLTTQSNLLYVLLVTLRTLHPFAPFTTEAMWRSFEQEGCLMNASWPTD